MWEPRSRYGEVYVSSFPDGTTVSWKPLIYGDFIYYTNLISEGRIPLSIIEDEIFKKITQDIPLTSNPDTNLAGIASTVAQHALQVSGPLDLEAFNQGLQKGRANREAPLNQVITLICQAFPAYKPEDVLALQYEDVMLRLAQAEEILLKAKILTQPISLIKERQPTNKRVIPAELKNIWDQRNAVTTKKEEKPAPVSEPIKHATINFEEENKAIANGMSGWDRIDSVVKKAKMIKEAESVHADFFKKKTK